MHGRILAIVAVILLAVSVFLGTGCAYFNTFYNMKRRFAEAEHDYKSRQQQPAPQSPGSPPGQPVGRPASAPPIPADKYRKVIEAGSKLLEYYPKSRWVDDALLIMGICYYRMGDLARAERKFTEIITLFEKSRNVSNATIWKARVLAESKKVNEAIELLQGSTERMTSSRQRAEAEFLLGSFHYQNKEWSDASEHFRAASKLRQSRAEHVKTLYYLGLSEYEQLAYTEAKDVFSQIAAISRDRQETYQAHVYWSRCEVALGNFEQAEKILTRLGKSESYSEFADDIQLELADLAVKTGRVEEGVAQYEGYVTERATGEKRGIAFYRMALVQRDHYLNLPLAKSLLDSAVRVGAPKETADSARAAMEQLSRGLLALETIKTLVRQIDSLQALPTETPDPEAKSELIAIPADSIAFADSSSVAAVPDTSAETAEVDSLSDSSRVRDPAAMTAEEIVKAVREDVARRLAESHQPPGDQPLDSGRVRPSAPADTIAETSEIRARRLAALKYQLGRAFLHVAEFYKHSLADEDSALSYYRLAADSRESRQTYWKANLYLAEAIQGNDSTLSDESRRRFQAVVDADSVPVEAANVARLVLGLPLLERPVAAQLAAFRAAEQAYLSGEAPSDSLIVLYSGAVDTSARTNVTRMALFAKAHLYENVLKNPDSARVAYAEVRRLFPDSSFSELAESKLLPPDTASVFNLTDDEIAQRTQPITPIIEEKADSTGWPPPEESLRGRRYH